MVDPVQLASDILQADAFFLVLPALWLFLFLFAWEGPELARRTGFGRTTFWLLLPGAVLASVSNLPFFGWEGAILAVNLGGGLIPVVVSMLLFRDHVGAPGPATATLVAALALETGAMLLGVFVLPAGWPTLVGLLTAAATAPIAVALLGRLGEVRRRTYLGRTAAFLALLSGVLVATYLSTATVPNVGIVSEFPYYLIGPVAAGVLAVALAPVAFDLPARAGMPMGYAAATLGVLFGADLLRQPPLYGNGAHIYAIGGAGVLDLVYLSGLLALAAAFLAHRVSGAREEPPGSVPLPPPPVSPAAQLRRALQQGLAGRGAEAIVTARGAAQAAADQARLLRGAPAPPPGAGPWTGLPVASWVVADQRNLERLADTGSRDPRDAFRAWTMARALVVVGRDLGRHDFGAGTARAWAFLLDTVVLAVPSVLLWVYLAQTIAGPAVDIASTPLFNAAALALPAYGFLYFVFAEAGTGTTLGKFAAGLRVTDRRLGAPRLVNVMVRDLPKLIPLSIVGIGGALFVLTATRGSAVISAAGPPVLAVSALALLGVFIALGVAVSGAISLLGIHESAEAQRLGDLFAGTWVVRATATGTAPAVSVPAGAAGRSG